MSELALRDRPAASAARADPRPASLGHGAEPPEARLAERCDRLRLVIRALDQRVGELTAARDAVPEPLLAAVRQFQTELASLSAGLHATVSGPRGAQRASRGQARREPAKGTP